MDTLDAILSRCSCRDYTDEQITEEQLNSLLVAANAAPVAMGTFQCMALTVIQDRALMNKIEEATVAAMPQSPNKHPLYNAPTCILVSVKKEEGMLAAAHPMSASCIMENMLIEAAGLGLGSAFLMGTAMVMAQNPELCKEAKVPDGFMPVAMAAIGHAAATTVKKEPKTEKIVCLRV